MISVILYGRNDAHGYNLHRRAALSLNCIAEVLTDPDDELIFVDYNTPDELPTFIEAISDTLTERTRRLLRVLRIPAAVHKQRYAARTHLPALEPISRNVAARRANPANRWLLSTNTDMIFVPLQERSMSDVCRELPDGFYELPRFELPEWLWERLPRTDPRRALAEVEHLGPALRLDEPTTSHEWIRFDAPGDCQLFLREDLIAIDGFNEDMLLGYHVDSNFSRRMLLHRGAIQSLEDVLAGYHCNHNRTPTVYHGRRVENDLQRFFYMVDRPDLPDQRDAWGLPDVTVYEVPLEESVDMRSAAPLVAAMPTRPRSSSDAMETPFLLTYDSGHVLPFVTDTLLVSSRDVRVGYVGVNAVLQQMLGATIGALGFAHPLLAAGFAAMGEIERVVESADILIIDLGVDVSQADELLQDLDRREFGTVPPGLADALPALYRLAELERSRYERLGHPRPIVLVNSSAVFWEPLVLDQFDCSYATVHSRVRRATVKPTLGKAAAELQMEYERASRLMRWIGRDQGGSSYLSLRPGQRVELGELTDYGGFGAGWSPPEAGGMWTLGRRTELRVEAEDIGDGEYALTLMIGMVCVGPEKPIVVELHVNGEPVAARRFTDSACGGRWIVDLPRDAVAAGKMELTLCVDDPQSPQSLGTSTDDRALGIHILSLSIAESPYVMRRGETLVVSDGSDAERVLGDGWGPVEPSGVWTVYDEARIALRLADPAVDGVDVVLDVVGFVTDRHPKLLVEVWTQQRRLATHVFRDAQPARALRVHVPAEVIGQDGRAVLDLSIRDPARPADVGLSEDPRRLGVQLRTLSVVEPAGPMSVTSGVATLRRKLRKQLGRSLRA